MEAVAAAASVAGLLSVAGHVLNGVATLDTFIRDLKEADARAERLTMEANLLSQTLIDFKSLLETVDKKALAESRPFSAEHCATFCSRLKACDGDIDDWTRSYRNFCSGSYSNRRKIRDGIRKKRSREISEMESKLARHRSQIVLDINTINVWISLGGFDKISAVHEAVKRLTETNLQMNQQSIDHSNIVFEEATRERQHLTDTILSTTQAFKQQVESDHHETRSQLSKLSDSVSSIADSLHQLVNSPGSKLSRRGSDCHPGGPWSQKTASMSSEMGKNKKRRRSGSTTSGDQPRPKTKRFVGRTGWTCGGAMGIDDFFIDCQGQHLGQMQCVLCNIRFSAMDSSLFQSRHIVDRHDFAGCDQGRHFLSKTKFESHLRESHAALEHVLRRHSLHVEKVFFCPRFSVVDERTRSLYGKPRKLERPTTPLILQSKLQHLLSDPLNSKTRTPDGAYSLHALWLRLEALSQLVFSAKFSPKLATILYQAANLAEELSVSCNQTLVKRWISTPSTLLQRISPVQGKENGDLDLEDTSQDTTRSTPYPYDTSADWEILAPGLKISSLMTKLRAGKSRRDRIDLWMLNTLHKSEHLLVVLRCSAFFDSSSISPSNHCKAQAERDGATCSLVWGSMWTDDLLGAFEGEEGAMQEDFHAVQSDGAVYSADDVAWPKNGGEIEVDVKTQSMPMHLRKLKWTTHRLSEIPGWQSDMPE